MRHSAAGFRQLLRTTFSADSSRSRDDLERFQARCLRRLIRHSYANVPYYRNLFDKHGLDPEEIRSAKDLYKIPITTKSVLQAEPLENLVANRLSPTKLIRAQTSGSTGRPMSVYRTWLEQTLLNGFLWRANRDFGLRAKDQMAAIGFQGSPHPRDRKIVGKTLRKIGLFQISQIWGGSPASEIADNLRNLRADVVTGYPTVLAHIADHLTEVDRSQIRPRFVMTGAEVLTQNLRHRITNGFQAPVLDVYSSREFHVIAWECRQTGLLHCSDDSVVTEVVSDGNPLAPGEAGEILGTALHSYAAPIIRYALGDRVVKGDSCCACGAPYTTIDEIQGKMTAYVRRPDGSQIHITVLIREILLTSQASLQQFQFLQERPEHLVLKVMTTEPEPSSALADLGNSLRSILGEQVRLRIQRVSEIPTQDSGKSPALISKLSL